MCDQLQKTLGRPPCSFVLVAFGSSTRNEMLPDSDLDICLLLGEDDLPRLRSHRYFKVFLHALNHLLKLCYGDWVCTKGERQHHEESLSYRNREVIYKITASGLRIDLMEMKDIETIIFSPATMTEWVVKHCTDLNPMLRTQDRILAYGLVTAEPLHPAFLFNQYSLNLLQYGFNKTYPQRMIMVETVQRKGNHFHYFLQERKDDHSRLVALWKKWNTLPYDKASLFIKDCLFLLDLWTKAMVSRLSQRHDFSFVLRASLQERLSYLEKNGFAPYFLQGIAQSRVILLHLKYQLYSKYHDPKLMVIDPLQRSLLHTVLPIAYHLSRYEDLVFTPPLDPYSEYIAQHCLEIMQIFPPPFSIISENINWLQQHQAKEEDYQRLYSLFSKVSNTLVGEPFIDYLVSRFGLTAPVTQALIQVPNDLGYRPVERLAYQRLFHSLSSLPVKLLADIEENKSLKVAIIWPNFEGKIHKRYLSSSTAKDLIDRETLDVKKHYSHSLHRVSPLTLGGYPLHIKQLPGQPLTDYGIDILTKRLVGQGTPANTLARLEIIYHDQKKTYPILISETIAGQTLRDKLKHDPSLSVNHASYTALILVALLSFPGDGASRNFIVSEQGKITFIDLDLHFVEPIIKKLSLNGLNKVQFSFILFCLNQANIPLDKETIQHFCQLKHPYSIIDGWINTLTSRQEQYVRFYPEGERKALYSAHKDEKFTPYGLLREGVLGNLLINLNYLQVHLSTMQDQPPSALALLATINPRLGYAYQEAYLKNTGPEKRLEAVTEAPQASISSVLALKASLGFVPTYEEIESQTTCSLQEAKKELYCLIDFKPDFSKLVDKLGQPDITRQQMMLKALALFPHTELCLSHCAALTDEIFIDVLAKSENHLKSLDLRACPYITVKAIAYLEEKHPQLQKLYLSDCINLEIMSRKGFFSNVPFQFPSLEILHVSRCVNLTMIFIHAPKLKEENLKTKDCTKLQKIMNTAHPPKRESAGDNVFTKENRSDSGFNEEENMPENQLLDILLWHGYDEHNSEIYFPLGMIHEGNFASIDALMSFTIGRYVRAVHRDTFAIEQKTQKLHNRQITMVISADSKYSAQLKKSLTLLHFINTKHSIEDQLIKFDNWITDYLDKGSYQVPVILVSYRDYWYSKMSQEDHYKCIALAKERGAIAYFYCNPEDQNSVNRVFIGAMEATIYYYGLWKKLFPGARPSFLADMPYAWFKYDFFNKLAQEDLPPQKQQVNENQQHVQLSSLKAGLFSQSSASEVENLLSA